MEMETKMETEMDMEMEKVMDLCGMACIPNTDTLINELQP